MSIQQSMGGEGGVLAESLLSPPLVRSNIDAAIEMLEDHGARAVVVPDGVLDGLVRVVQNLQGHKSMRMQATGAKLALALLNYMLKRVSVAGAVAQPQAKGGTTVTNVLVIQPPKVIGEA